MTCSRISGFYQRNLAERLQALAENGFLNDDDLLALQAQRHVLSPGDAEHMVENVIGVFALPLGVALNFTINDRDYVVPLVVEEPSIIAALSAAAKIMRQAGGITSKAAAPLVYGQVQVVEIPDLEAAHAALRQHQDEILQLANQTQSRMVARGGGAKQLEVILHHADGDHAAMLTVQILVDTRDAMGANVVNSICEAVAPRIAEITSGRVLLRILSNLTDRSLVHVSCTIPPKLLATTSRHGERVRDDIVLASDLACVDAHRAATHNKGIMNGIDAVAIATGNDWRAIEAGAHAYAGRGPRYTALTRWTRDDHGNLHGKLTMPLQVGIVGASLLANPSVGINLRMLGVTSAPELGAVMGAVGFAQNFAALRALVTDGIQHGHMALHARSVVASTGATGAVFETAVRELVASGDIKTWHAEQIVARLTADQPQSHNPRGNNPPRPSQESSVGIGHGKVILLGEHAAVYGSHALAAPIPMAIKAKVTPGGHQGVHLAFPAWSINETWLPTPHGETKPARGDKRGSAAAGMLELLLHRLDLASENLRIDVEAELPPGMGLGGSAALAVACVRALSHCFRLCLSEDEVNAHAFACEQCAHDTPSGVDNTVATFGRLLLYQRGTPALMRPLDVPHPITVVIGQSGISSSTAAMVSAVRAARERTPRAYDRIFEQIDALTLQAAAAIQDGNYQELGELMNICQGLLSALQVSRVELEQLVHIARKHGALGAKLTGSGGGGSVVALCPENAEDVMRAMQRAGFKAFVTNLG